MDHLEEDYLEAEIVEEYTFEEGKFLITVNNELEAGIIEGLLHAKDIQVIKKHKEAGAYLSVYMGASNFGMDIYVPEHQWQEAKELVEQNNMIIANEKTDEVLDEENITFSEQGDGEDWDIEKKQATNKRRMISMIILLIFVLPAILTFISRWF